MLENIELVRIGDIVVLFPRLTGNSPMGDDQWVIPTATAVVYLLSLCFLAHSAL